MKDTKRSKYCIDCINYDKKIDKEPCKICIENIREKSEMDIDIRLDKITPIDFYPYPSVVLNRILSMEYNNNEYIKQFKNELINMFINIGIRAYANNKIVFKCEINNIIIYIGFYDWRFSIGFSYWKEK